MTNMPKDWQKLLAPQLELPYYSKLMKFVESERAAHPDAVFPDDASVFNALRLTSVKKIRVVVLGQDPYPTRGHAHGLAFSVQPDVKPFPASLRNIFKELVSDLNVPQPSTGSLIPWAKQGVLLLNTVLTVREGEANSHQKQGWENLTDAIISALSEQSEHVIFVLWGKPAQKKEKLIDLNKHAVLKSAHPSPLAANTGFFGSRPFSSINTILRQWHLPTIDWQLA
ncbi:MAG: uracil-DNA glycosylase [Pirellulales bacterium]